MVALLNSYTFSAIYNSRAFSHKCSRVITVKMMMGSEKTVGTNFTSFITKDKTAAQKD